MAVDLTDLVPSLKLEISPPGEDLFSTVTTDEWVGRLANGFWNARLDGILSGFVESGGVVTPESGTTDISRDMQQVIVFFAAYDAIILALRTLNTSFRAKAGPVEFETQQSANLLRDVAADLKSRRDILLRRLSDLGSTPAYVIDSVIARQDSLMASATTWVSY